MVIQKKLQKVISKLSIKYNLPENVIEEIYTSEFDYLKKIIRSDKLETIKFPNWGKFYPSIKKLQYIKKRMDKNKIRNEIEIDKKINQNFTR